jgi:multiple sugar transport system substrate-binding protein
MQRMAQEATDRFYFKLSNNVSLLNLFTRNSGMMVRAYAGEGSAAIDADDEIAGIQAMSDGSVPFSYGKGFGINSQSKNKALAWAFIKFLLSDETQLSSISAMDIPVNNKARDEKLELIFSGIFGNIRMGPGGGGGRTEEIVLNAQQRQSLENYKAAVERLSDNINSFVVQDTSVNDMIASEVQYYFDGSRTAQEVARVLQNKVDLYLNE